MFIVGVNLFAYMGGSCCCVMVL